MFFKLCFLLVHLNTIKAEHPLLTGLKNKEFGNFGFVGLKERLNGSLDYIENVLGHRVKYNESIHSFDNISYKYLTECDVKTPLNKFLFTTTNHYERNTYRKRFFQQESREAMFTKKYEAKYAKLRASSTKKITRFTDATNMFDSRNLKDNLLEFYPDMVHHLVSKISRPRKFWTGTYPPENIKQHPNNTTPMDWSLDIRQTYSDEDYKGPERRLDPKDSMSAYGLSLPKEKVHYPDEYNSQVLPELERQWKIRGDKKNIEANLDRPSMDHDDSRMYRPAGTHYLAGCKIDLNHYRPFETMNETLNPYLPYNEFYLRPGFDPVAWHRTIRQLHYELDPNSELKDPDIRKLFTVFDSENYGDIAANVTKAENEEDAAKEEKSGELDDLSTDYYRSDIYADSMLTTAELAEKKRRKLLKANATKKATKKKMKRRFSLAKTEVPYTTKSDAEIKRIFDAMYDAEKEETTEATPYDRDGSDMDHPMFKQKELLHKLYPNVTRFQLEELNELGDFYVRGKEILNCSSFTINMQNLRNIELRHGVNLSNMPHVPMVYWVHPNRTTWSWSKEKTHPMTLPPTDFIVTESLESYMNMTPFNIENIRNIERKFNITLNDDLVTELPDSIVRLNDFLTVRADKSNDYHDLVNYGSPLRRRKREILEDLKSLIGLQRKRRKQSVNTNLLNTFRVFAKRKKRSVPNNNLGSIESNLKRWNNHEDLTKISEKDNKVDHIQEKMQGTTEGVTADFYYSDDEEIQREENSEELQREKGSVELKNEKDTEPNVKTVRSDEKLPFSGENMADFDMDRFKNMDTEELKKIHEHHKENKAEIDKYLQQNRDFINKHQDEIVDKEHMKLAKEIHEKMGNPPTDYFSLETTIDPKLLKRRLEKEKKEREMNEKIYKLSNIRNRLAPIPGDFADYYALKMGWRKTEEPPTRFSEEIKYKPHRNDGKIDPFQPYFKLPSVEDVKYVYPETTTVVPLDFRYMNKSQVADHILKHGIESMLKLARQRTTMSYNEFKKKRLLEGRKNAKGEIRPRPKTNKERINAIFDENWKVKDLRLKRRRKAKEEKKEKIAVNKIPFYVKARMKDTRHRKRILDKKVVFKVDHIEGNIVTQKVTIKQPVGPLHYHIKKKKGEIKFFNNNEVFKINLVEEKTTIRTRAPYDPEHESDYSEEDRPVNKGVNFETSEEEKSETVSKEIKENANTPTVSGSKRKENSAASLRSYRQKTKEIQKEYDSFDYRENKKRRKDPNLSEREIIKDLNFHSCGSIKSSPEIEAKVKNLMKGFRKRKQKLFARRKHAKYYNFTEKSLMSSESDPNDIISLDVGNGSDDEFKDDTPLKNYRYVKQYDGSKIYYEKEYMDSNGNPINGIIRKDSSEEVISTEKQKKKQKKVKNNKSDLSNDDKTSEQITKDKKKENINKQKQKKEKHNKSDLSNDDKTSKQITKDKKKENRNKQKQKKEKHNKSVLSNDDKTSEQITKDKKKENNNKQNTLKRNKRFLRLSTPPRHTTKGFHYIVKDPIVNEVTHNNIYSFEDDLLYSIGWFDVTTTTTKPTSTVQLLPDDYWDLNKYRRRDRRNIEQSRGFERRIETLDANNEIHNQIKRLDVPKSRAKRLVTADWYEKFTRTVFTRANTGNFEDLLYDPIIHSTFNYETPRHPTKDMVIDYFRRKRSCDEKSGDKMRQNIRDGVFGNYKLSVDILLKNILRNKRAARVRRQALAGTTEPVTEYVGQFDDPLSNCCNNSLSREEFRRFVSKVKVKKYKMHFDAIRPPTPKTSILGKPKDEDNEQRAGAEEEKGERGGRVRRGDLQDLYPDVRESGESHNIAKFGVDYDEQMKPKTTPTRWPTPPKLINIPNPTKTKLILDIEKRFSLKLEDLTTPYTLKWSPYGLVITNSEDMDSDSELEVMDWYQERESPTYSTKLQTDSFNLATEAEPTLYDYDGKMTPFNIENIRKIEKKFNVSLKDLENHPDNVPIEASTFGYGLIGFADIIKNISHEDTIIDKMDPNLVPIFPTDWGFFQPNGQTIEYGARDWALKDMLAEWKKQQNGSFETLHRRAENLTWERQKEECKRLGISWTQPLKLTTPHYDVEEFTGVHPTDEECLEDHMRHVDYVNEYNRNHSLFPKKYTEPTLDARAAERERTIMDWILRDYTDIRLEHAKRLAAEEKKHRPKRGVTSTYSSTHKKSDGSFEDFEYGVVTGKDCYQTFDDPEEFAKALKSLENNNNNTIKGKENLKKMLNEMVDEAATKRRKRQIDEELSNLNGAFTQIGEKRVKREMPYLGFSGLTTRIIFDWTNYPYDKTMAPFYARRKRIQAKHRPTNPDGGEINIKRKQWTIHPTPEPKHPPLKWVHGIAVRESLDYGHIFRHLSTRDVSPREKRDVRGPRDLEEYSIEKDQTSNSDKTLDSSNMKQNSTLGNEVDGLGDTVDGKCDDSGGNVEQEVRSVSSSRYSKNSSASVVTPHSILKRDLFTGFAHWDIIRKPTPTKTENIKNIERRFSIDVAKITTSEPLNMTFLLEIMSAIVFNYRDTEAPTRTEPARTRMSSVKFHTVYSRDKRAVDRFWDYVQEPLVKTVYRKETRTPTTLLPQRRPETTTLWGSETSWYHQTPVSPDHQTPGQEPTTQEGHRRKRYITQERRMPYIRADAYEERVTGHNFSYFVSMDPAISLVDRLKRSLRENPHRDHPLENAQKFLKSQQGGQTESWLKRFRREMPYLGFSGLTTRIIFDWTNYPYDKTMAPFYARRKRIQAKHRPTNPDGGEINIKRKQWTIHPTPEPKHPPLKWVHGIAVRESLDYGHIFRHLSTRDVSPREKRSVGSGSGEVDANLASETKPSTDSSTVSNTANTTGSTIPNTVNFVSSIVSSTTKVSESARTTNPVPTKTFANTTRIANDKSKANIHLGVKSKISAVDDITRTNNNTETSFTPPATNATTDADSQNPGGHIINSVQTLGRKKRSVNPQRRTGKDLFEKIIMAYFNCNNVWKEPHSPEILQIRRRYREQKHRHFNRVFGRRKHEHEDIYYE